MKKLSAICIILTLFSVGCDDAAEPDTTPPTIIITNPVDGVTLTESVTIKVDATDNEGVDMVEIAVDGETIATITSAPYDFDWNVSFWADGNAHSILAKATDPSGNVGTSDLISVTVSTAALSLTLVSPLDNEIIRNTNVINTRWRALSEAVSYDLEVSTDSNFSVIVYFVSLADTTSITTTLTQSNHYWRVKGKNDIGEETEWSLTSSFLLDGPEAPGLVNPMTDSLFIGISTLTLEWNSSEFTTLYEVNVSITSDFTSNEYEEITTGTKLITTTLADGKHYWRVRAQNSVGFWGDWSSSSTFLLSENIKDFEIRELIQSERPWNDYSSPIDLNAIIVTDTNGVLMWEWKGNSYYHPVNLSGSSLHNIFSYNLTQNSEYLIRAERYMQKLIEESLRINSSIYFSYNFDIHPHGTYPDFLLAPWYSGMAQGVGLAALVRLYNTTGNEIYLIAAENVFSTFKRIGHDLEPWTVFINEKGYYWIEEYPINFPEDAADKVLNGFIFGIYGLYEYYLLTKGSDEKNILLAAITTIYNYISYYRDIGDVSFYCLRHEHKDIGYHFLHQKQLSMLSNITGDPFFQSMADSLYDDFH